MKQIHLSLDGSYRDTLQYHNRFVQIFSLVNKYYKQSIITWEDGCMRFTFSAGYQQVEVSIDINDVASRLVRILRADLFMLNGHPGLQTTVAKALLSQLDAISQILADHSTKIYWFEFSSVAGFADCKHTLLYEYLKLKRFAGYDDTVHNCMLVLSVLNDLYKLLRESSVMSISYEQFERTAVNSTMWRQIVRHCSYYLGPRSVSEDTRRLFELVFGYCRSESVPKSRFDDLEFNFSYAQQNSIDSYQMIALQRIREVLCLLKVMPFEYYVCEEPALSEELYHAAMSVR